MLFIYSIELETLNLELHDCCMYHKDAADMLRNIAVSFIRTECGDKRAKDAFKDNVTDPADIEDGYFLRRSDKTTNRIDVYLKKTLITPGWIGNSVSTEINHVKFYSITEASLGMPIEKKMEMKKPEFHTERQAAGFDDLITELKKKLHERNSRENVNVDIDIVSELDTLLEDFELVSETNESNEVRDYSENSSPVSPPLPPSLPPTPPPLPVFNTEKNIFEKSESSQLKRSLSLPVLDFGKVVKHPRSDMNIPRTEDLSSNILQNAKDCSVEDFEKTIADEFQRLNISTEERMRRIIRILESEKSTSDSSDSSDSSDDGYDSLTESTDSESDSESNDSSYSISSDSDSYSDSEDSYEEFNMV